MSIKNTLTTVLSILFIISSNISYSQYNATYSEDEIKLQTSVLDAKLLLYKKDTAAAITAYKTLLKSDQKPIAAFELSKIYLRQSDYGNAASYGNKALTQLGDKEGYLLHMLSVYHRSDNQKLYLTTLTQLSERFPDNDGYFFNKVDVLTDKKEYKNAIKLLDKKQKLDGITEEITKRKFDIFMTQNKPKKAEKVLLAIVKKYPKELLYLYNLASFYGQTSMQSKSKEIYKRILAINPYDKNAKAILSQEVYESDNTDLFYLQSLIPVVENPNTPLDKIIKKLIPYIDKVNHTYESSTVKTLVQLTEKLSISHKSDAKAMSIYADMLYISGDLSTSKQQYIKTIALDKSVFSVWRQLLLILDRTKDYKTLLTYSDKALDYYPNQAITYIYSGIANTKLSKIKEAKSLFEEAKILSAYSDNFTKQLYKLSFAQLLIQQQNPKEAKSILTEFESNTDKLSFEILEKMSQLFMEMNDLQRATKYKDLSIKEGNKYKG